MKLQLILNILFLGYFVDHGECKPDEKVHIKIHVPVKYHKHTQFLSHDGKHHTVVHKHNHKHGHKHDHGHKHGHKHGHDHKHKHEGKHSHKHDHKHAHKHDGKHNHKHEGKHEHKHESKHQHKHEGKQGHKHHHDHKHKGKHDHKHKHIGKHGHKHSHKDDHHYHQDHKDIIIEPVFGKDATYEKINNQAEVFSKPYESSFNSNSDDYSDDDESYNVGASYKVQEHDPFDTSPPPPPPPITTTTTPNPFDLADQVFDVNEGFKGFLEDDFGDDESSNEEKENYKEDYTDDSRDGSNYKEDNNNEDEEHSQNIQDYIDNAAGDMENYVDYDYTEPKIQYAEKIHLPDGKYTWNDQEVEKYLEQTYGTELKDGEYEKYAQEESTKVLYKVTPEPATGASINPNVAPVTFPTTESDFQSKKFR